MDTYITATTRSGVSASRSLEARINNLMAAWEQQAPEAKFVGMTLADFRIAMNPALQALQRKKQLHLEMRAAVQASENAEAVCRPITDQVVAAVKAEGLYGPDSPLYRAMGFVPKSERKRGKNQAQIASGTTTPKALVG